MHLLKISIQQFQFSFQFFWQSHFIGLGPLKAEENLVSLQTLSMKDHISPILYLLWFPLATVCSHPPLDFNTVFLFLQHLTNEGFVTPIGMGDSNEVTRWWLIGLLISMLWLWLILLLGFWFRPSPSIYLHNELSHIILKFQGCLLRRLEISRCFGEMS